MRKGQIGPKTASFVTRNRYDPETGCWNWTGVRNSEGYGYMKYLGKHRSVHRISAHCYLGFDLDSPLIILHRCDNPSCFNPKHLTIGTNSDNQRDCVRKGRKRNQYSGITQCKRGHDLTPDNTRWVGSWRYCKACQHFRAQRRWEANRARAL